MKISIAQKFWFCKSNATHFPTPREYKNFLFFPLHCPGRNAISSKVFNEFSKNFFWLKDYEGGYCGWKFQLHRNVGFAIATLHIFQHPENVKISIFPFTLSQQKYYIFKSISRIFKNVFRAERWWRWLLLLKISGAPRFWFCNNSVTTFPTSRKCIDFNVSLYTVPAEILYLQKYLTNFQKLFFGRTMRKVAIVVENFKCTDFLVLQ